MHSKSRLYSPISMYIHIDVEYRYFLAHIWRMYVASAKCARCKSQHINVIRLLHGTRHLHSAHVQRSSVHATDRGFSVSFFVCGILIVTHFFKNNLSRSRITQIVIVIHYCGEIRIKREQNVTSKHKLVCILPCEHVLVVGVDKWIIFILRSNYNQWQKCIQQIDMGFHFELDIFHLKLDRFLLIKQ